MAKKLRSAPPRPGARSRRARWPKSSDLHLRAPGRAPAGQDGQKAQICTSAPRGAEVDRPRTPGDTNDLPMTNKATAQRISDVVHARGGRALYVGGWVRDRLLGLDSSDIDVEVFGMDADGLLELLRTIGPVDAVGRAFTVYKLDGVDVSIPRRESKTGQGHRGFTVTGDPGMTVREAARRRDFTINAMAWDPVDQVLIDPFGGQADLQQRRLRAVDPATFGDDSLRVLRASSSPPGST